MNIEKVAHKLVDDCPYHMDGDAWEELRVTIANAIREAMQLAFEEAAALARKEPTWVEYNSYKAQCGMREDIAKALERRASKVV